MSTLQNHIRSTLQLLWDTLPDASRRKTARGRLRTCRELGDFRRRAEQLYAYVECSADLESIDSLVREIEHRREALVAEGRIRDEVRAEAAARRAKRLAIKWAQLLTASKTIGRPPLPNFHLDHAEG